MVHIKRVLGQRHLSDDEVTARARTRASIRNDALDDHGAAVAVKGARGAGIRERIKHVGLRAVLFEVSSDEGEEAPPRRCHGSARGSLWRMLLHMPCWLLLLPWEPFRLWLLGG